MREKLEKLYGGYLRKNSTKEMNELISMMTDEKFVKRSRQIEVMANYVIDVDTMMKKLMQLIIMTDINYKVHKKLHERNIQDLQND